MAEETEKSGADASATPEGKPDAKSELPTVDSPSISPVEPDSAAETEKTPALAPSMSVVPFAEPVVDSPIAPDASTKKSFRLRARHKLYATMAASVVFAAAVGGLAGFAANGGFKKPDAPRVDTAALEDRKAMQQSLAKLNKEIGTLKTNLEAANKAATTQIAKMSEKLTEKLSRDAAEITGSISAPQTTAAAPAATPLPTPRPARVASAEPPRPTVVPDWSIRDTRDGYVYVQGHGEIYQVVPGAPLPGLGPVEQIKRQDGRWIVVTPRGLIVSARDRSYFE